MESACRGQRIDIASIRRDQIVQAAVAVISEKGIQNLSLSEIEKKVGMSRGQLTYYFHTKEDILLAVFDRLVEMMCQRAGQACDPGVAKEPQTWQDVVRHVLGVILQRPPLHPEFGPLQYTFLSQIGHRADFRQRLAHLYEDWRRQMAGLLEERLTLLGKSVSPRALASLIQAILHGVAMQNAADPEAIDREEIAQLCLDVLGTYLELGPQPGSPRRDKPAGRPRHSSVTNGVKHE